MISTLISHSFQSAGATPTICIAGTSFSSLLLGNFLARAHYPFIILAEQESIPEYDYALHVPINALGALNLLNLSSPVLKAGNFSLSHLKINHSDTPLTFLPSNENLTSTEHQFQSGSIHEAVDPNYGPLSFGILSHSFLSKSLLSPILDRIQLNAQISTIETKNDKTVILTLKNKRKIESDLLIGADGILSPVRNLIHPSSSILIDRKILQVSGLLPISKVENILSISNGYEWEMLGNKHSIEYTKYGDNTVSVSCRFPYISSHGYPHSIEHLDSSIINSLPEVQQSLLKLMPLNAFVSPIISSISDQERWGKGPVTLIGEAAHPFAPHNFQPLGAELEDAVMLYKKVMLAVAKQRLGNPSSSFWNIDGRNPIHFSDSLAHFEESRMQRIKSMKRVGDFLLWIESLQGDSFIKKGLFPLKSPRFWDWMFSDLLTWYPPNFQR